MNFRRKTPPPAKRLASRASVDAFLGDGGRATSNGAPESMTVRYEVPLENWAASSFDLSRGADVYEIAYTVPAELFDESDWQRGDTSKVPPK